LAVNVTEVDPTATHAEADVHETAASREYATPGGAGASCTDHTLPFHRSTRGAGFPDEPCHHPTAMHMRLDVHDTDINLVAVAPGTAAARRIVH
jgi:hypothetical protein